MCNHSLHYKSFYTDKGNHNQRGADKSEQIIPRLDYSRNVFRSSLSPLLSTSECVLTTVILR